MADKKNAAPLPQPTAAEVEFAQQLVERAKADGVSLVGPGGLLAGITRTVLESALDAELDAHLDEAGVDETTGRWANVRNGHGAKTVQTEVGPVRIQVPRDRAGSFAPRIVPKHARRLDGFNEAILSLYAKGLTTGEISAHLADVYDADVSRELVSRVTDSVLDEMEAWRQRPLDRIYPVVFIDALVMKIRQGQVANRPVYVVVGISLDGERDVLGMWAGTGGEGAKQWAGYLTELRNRGVEDVFMVCSDGLKGMTDAIEQAWPQAVHQQCVVHLVRASLRYTNRKDWQKITPPYGRSTPPPPSRLRRPVSRRSPPTSAPSIRRDPALADLLGAVRAVPRLRPRGPQGPLHHHIIESLNARFRQAARRRGHFPTEQAAMKVLYLVVQQKRKGGGSITGRVYGWAKALNALVLAYGDRIAI